MTYYPDSQNLGIHGTQIEGFERLNVKAPFVGYQKAKDYFRNCVPKSLSEQQYLKMMHLLGVDKGAELTAYASNVTFIQKLSKGLQQKLVEEWKLNGERELYILTITPAEWMVNEYDPVVDLARWKRQARRWLYRLGVTGIAIIEAAPFVNYPWKREGRAISFHLHAICYKTNPSTYGAAEKQLRAQLDATMLIPFPSIVTRRIMQNESSVAYTSGYISKSGVVAKYLTMKPGEKVKLSDTNLPKFLGLRMAEIMSFLTPQELILTTGTASEWRNAILKNVGPIGTRRFPNRQSDSDLNRLWREVKGSILRKKSSSNRQDVLSRHRPIQINR